MKKLTLYTDLRHECSGYWTKAIDVEKIVELNPTEFYRLKRETLKDNPFVKIYRDLTWSAGDTAQCVLFLEADGNNGILVDTDGTDYAKNSQYIPNARALIEYNEIVPMEKKIHSILMGVAGKMAELAHTGENSFCFDDILGDTDIKSTMIAAVGELLRQRVDIQSVEIDDYAYDEEPKFMIEPKPIHKLKFYSPVLVYRETEHGSDWDISGKYEKLSKEEKLKCRNEINEAIKCYFSPSEKLRGLMTSYNKPSAVCEKIYSAFPSVDDVGGTLMGVLVCEVACELTKTELEEVRSWWNDECGEDGWAESFTRCDISTAEFGDVYVDFWSTGDAMSIKTEEELKNITDTADHEETENLKIGGISM